MTDENLPATATDGGLAVDDDDLTGLEDFETSDFVTPRLKINMGEAVFEDTLSGAKFGKVQVILLGLVKQRILWDVDVDNADGPLCKSVNFRDGMPGDGFPWEASGYDEDSQAEDGTLKCEGCALKEWGSHPSQETPWCSEQHTFPLLMLDDDGNTSPAILSLQRSGIKPSKAYLSAFAKSKTPLFTAITEIELQPRKRGSVNFAVPKFVQVGKTDEQDYSAYAQAFRSMRDFLHTPRVDEDATATEDDDEDEAPAPAPPAQPKKKAKPKPSTQKKPSKGKSAAEKKSTPRAVEPDDDDDLDDDVPF